MSGETPETLLLLCSEIAEVLDSKPDETWLVGGVVRDALLGRPLLDVDIATTRDPAAVARRIARAIGGSPFPLGESHGCWRVVGGERQVDVCALHGETVFDDLAVRDFTINAMAVDCVDGEAIIDPSGGRADLDGRTLRMVSAHAFDADPLRLLRAPRFAHTLGLDLDDATAQAVAHRAGRVNEPSGERIFAELSLLLRTPEARRAVRLIDRLGLLSNLLPELDACRGLTQSRFHHLDVFEHTLGVLDNCEDIVAATDFWLPLPAEMASERPEWNDEQRLIVLLGALMHDLGKPATHSVGSTGRVSFVGHDKAGIAIAAAICKRWRTSGAVRDGVKRLVATHLELGFLLHGEFDRRARWRFLRSVEPNAAEAIVLSLGDRLATAGVDDRRRWMRRHVEAARACWIDHWNEYLEGQPEPLLDGNEIASAAEIEPGPALGALVGALAEEQAVGTVGNRAQAVSFVKEELIRLQSTRA